MGKSKKQRATPYSSPSSLMAAPSSSSSAAAPPPSPPSAAAAKKGFLRRILPFLLTANLAIGVYVLARTWKREPTDKEGEATEKVASSPVLDTGSASSDKTVSPESLPPPVKALPIPQHEQRELFKWILEEKRKVKSTDAFEKKKIDEEKALLKQLIQAESIPSL